MVVLTLVVVAVAVMVVERCQWNLSKYLETSVFFDVSLECRWLTVLFSLSIIPSRSSCGLCSLAPYLTFYIPYFWGQLSVCSFIYVVAFLFSLSYVIYLQRVTPPQTVVITLIISLVIGIIFLCFFWTPIRVIQSKYSSISVHLTQRCFWLYL